MGQFLLAIILPLLAGIGLWVSFHNKRKKLNKDQSRVELKSSPAGLPSVQIIHLDRSIQSVEGRLRKEPPVLIRLPKLVD